jgi:hypothetical protein
MQISSFYIFSDWPLITMIGLHGSQVFLLEGKITFFSLVHCATFSDVKTDNKIE